MSACRCARVWVGLWTSSSANPLFAGWLKQTEDFYSLSPPRTVLFLSLSSSVCLCLFFFFRHSFFKHLTGPSSPNKPSNTAFQKKKGLEPKTTFIITLFICLVFNPLRSDLRGVWTKTKSATSHLAVLYTFCLFFPLCLSDRAISFLFYVFTSVHLTAIFCVACVRSTV